MIDFVLISNKRTGSTFLQECINSHPDIKCYDEMFMIRAKNAEDRENVDYYRKYKNDMNVLQYLNFLSKKAKRKKSGVRIVYPQLDYWKDLREEIKIKNIPVIHLIRRNYFEQSMSYHTKNITDDEKIHIEPEQLIWRIQKIKEETEKFKKEYRKNSKYIEIFYENMFGKKTGKKNKIRPMGTFNLTSKQQTYLKDLWSTKICRFLKVRDFQLNSNVTKRSKWNVSEYIENWSEIRKILIQNGYKEMIRRYDI